MLRLGKGEGEEGIGEQGDLTELGLLSVDEVPLYRELGVFHMELS